MQHRRFRLFLVALLAAILTGCGGDDSGEAAPDTAADVDPGTEVRQVAVFSADSAYVQGLCSIDFFAPDMDDPIGWLAREIDALPTSEAEEAEERQWLVERLRRVNKIDDPLANDDLSSAAAVLAARCSP
ncbi:MAG: hypothetical protein JJE52_08760 [Acidimicrobiia bacterium]|nr:hypothetical protein [Acidimicrobiia bacterium]